MKKRERLAACVLALAVVAGTGLGKAAGEEPLSFVVREQDGVVTVFSGERAEPTGISACHLPEADREKLRDGIGASSREELAELLEDLGS